MSSGILVEVKLRPYLQDYVINKYEGDPVVKATAKNKIFPLLFPYLSKIPSDYKPLKDCIKFELPWNHMIDVKTYQYIHPKYFGDIQSYFYGIFYVEFVSYMNHAFYEENLQLKTSIINFCLDHEISFDNANYDSLKRIYSRYRYTDNKKKLSIKTLRK
jgi:hypothetical protein